jgi:hypothetical protein
MLTFNAAWIVLCSCLSAQRPAEPAGPEARGVAFLAVEVPRWSREHRCYSCHNNGDAARSLYLATRMGYRVPADALASTTTWLSRPDRWEHNGGVGPASDKKLARVAFTTALASAVANGWARDRTVLMEAARRLVQDQDKGGAWAIEGEPAVSSPAAYGQSLATYLARESLASADAMQFRGAIARADAWLAGREVISIADAAVALLAAAVTPAPETAQRRRRSLEILRRGQSDDGGWGSHAASPPEIFDTALAVLALARSGHSPEVRGMLSRGRAFLIAQQNADGSWTETTRPAGNVSYAQRISTSGWSLLALLETREEPSPSGRNPKR